MTAPVSHDSDPWHGPVLRFGAAAWKNVRGPLLGALLQWLLRSTVAGRSGEEVVPEGSSEGSLTLCPICHRVLPPLAPVVTRA